jgi:phosphoribosylcarboxyaminoimidazole (NCAIR) mutase
LSAELVGQTSIFSIITMPVIVALASIAWYTNCNNILKQIVNNYWNW